MEWLRNPCERDTARAGGWQLSSSVLQGPFTALFPAATWFCPVLPHGWGRAWSAGWTSRGHWWVWIILTNPSSSENYTGLFVHNRMDPRRFRVKWFFTLEAKLGTNSFPVFFSRCKVWGTLQWQVHFVLEGSWTFGPQHISQLFITAANSCSFALDVYLKCVLQALEQLSWDCL